MLEIPTNIWKVTKLWATIARLVKTQEKLKAHVLVYQKEKQHIIAGDMIHPELVNEL